MSTRKMVLLVLLTLSLTMLHGQSNYTTSRIVQTIDSIAKVNHITKAEAYFNRISGNAEGTFTTEESISGVGTFRFEGPFIVIGSYFYFNTEKITQFRIFKDRFLLYFQAY